MTADRLDRRALNRATLARQLLLERRTGEIVEVVGHLVGLQAQAPWPPYHGLHARIDGFDPAELGRLLEGGTLVRAVTMRGTIHLMAPGDAAGVRAHLQPVLDRQLSSQKARREALAGVDLDAVAEVGAALLDREALTAGELGERLAERFTGIDPPSLAMVVRCRVPVVQVPPRAVWGRTGPPRMMALEAWVRSARRGRRGARTWSMPAAMPLDELVRRYLASFGPASVQDVQTWSGLTRLAAVVSDMGDELLRFTDEDGVELVDLPDAPRPGPDVAAPVRLLPDFDDLLLSHADRRRVLAERHRARMASRNGMPPATVLLDGEARASWRVERTGGTATVVVRRWEPRLPPGTRDELEAEALRVLAMAAPDADHDVRITGS